MPLLIGYGPSFALAKQKHSGGSSPSASSSPGSSGGGGNNAGQTGSNNGGSNPPTNNNPPATPDNTGGVQNQGNTGSTNQQQCPTGEHFDNKKNKCVKDTSNQQALVGTSSTHNKTAALATTPVICTGETHLVAGTGQCVSNSIPLPDGSCVAGWHIQNQGVPLPDKRCVKDILTTLTTPTLSTGGVLEKNNPSLGCVRETHPDAGQCVTNGNQLPGGGCVAGYHLHTVFPSSEVLHFPSSESVHCIKDEPITGGVLEKNNPSLGCVGETHYDHGTCVTDFIPLPDGSCVAGRHIQVGDLGTTCNKDESTPTGTPNTGGGEVTIPANTDGSCPSGYHQVVKDTGLVCVKDTSPPPTAPANADGSCPSGYHKAPKEPGHFICVIDASTSSTPTTPTTSSTTGICKPGSHQDANTGKCILTCDLGYHYDAAKDLCVPDAKTTPAQLPAGTGGGGSTTGGNKNSTTLPPLSSTSSTTIKIISKNIIEGSQPIGSSSSPTSGDTTGKLFLEFNNRTNAAAGLVVTNTTLTKNQLVSGQVDINGHIQNIRPADTSTTANTNNVNTARMIVVVATFYDNANNTISVQHGGYDPNPLGPGQSSVFHLVANNVGNNIDHAVYLVQWLGLDRGNGALLLHPTTQEVNGAAAAFPTK